LKRPHPIFYAINKALWQGFSARDGLPGSGVSAIIEDRDGYLWFGGKGLSRFDGQTFKNYTAVDGLPFKDLLALAEDLNGHFWLSAGNRYSGEGSGVAYYDRQRFRIFTTEDGLAHDMVWDILEDRDGYVWFATSNGVSRYDGQTFTNFTSEDGLPHQKIYDIFADRHGVLWFGTWGGGISHYDGVQFTTLTTKDGLAGNEVYGMMEDRYGVLWPGTVPYDDGKFAVREGLPVQNATSIFEDRDGVLWFAGGNGVIRYDGRSATRLTKDDGLASNHIWSIIQDHDGHMWFGHYGDGVSRYDGLVIQHLSRSDGLVSDVVQEVRQVRNGDFWIVTEGGITRYRPSRTPPQIHITGVIADQPYESVAALELSSSQKLVLFQFQGGSLTTLPDKMAYVYRMVGYDDVWKTTRQQQVQYQNLPVGNYTFEVKAVDRNLNYSTEAATVEVAVFYQPIASSIGLADIHIQDLYASFYKSYADKPIGSVRVFNKDPHEIEATLSFFVPELMRRPTKQNVRLASESSQRIDLLPWVKSYLLPRAAGCWKPKWNWPV